MKLIFPTLVLLVVASFRALAQSPPEVLYVYDELGRLVGVVDTAGQAATYSYDAAGNLLSITRTNSGQVSIMEFAPNGGPVGTGVTIFGTGFSTTPAQNVVKFNGVTASVVSSTATKIVTSVPAGATTGAISVTAPGGTATSATAFIVGPSPAPTITGFNPTVGVKDDVVTITGTNFVPGPGTTRVTFNNTLGWPTAVTATSFSVKVPLGATSGRIGVSTAKGSALSASYFFVPPDPSVVADIGLTGSMSIGETKTITLATANKIGLIAFDGTAGQRISLDMAFGAGLSEVCTYVSIQSPGGAYLVTPRLGCGPSARFFSDVLTLTATGTYTVVVDPDGVNVGTATLTLYDVPADTAATIQANGTPLPVATTVPGQNAHVTFSGTAGQRISLNIVFGTGLSGVCSTVSIQSPGGADLVTPHFTCGPSAQFFSDALTLTATGTYTVVVDPYEFNVGTTTLTLYEVPPDPVSTLQSGVAVPITTTTPGQNLHGTFTFETCTTYQLQYQCVECNDDLLCGPGHVTCCENVSAGRRVALNVSYGTGMTGTCHYVSVRNPDGTVLIPPTFACPPIPWWSDVFVLPAAGTYEITVDPYGASAGSMTLTLYDVPPDATATVSVNGTPAAVTITTPGQAAVVSFSGSAGQTVTVPITGNTVNGTNVELRRPDGSPMTSSLSAAASFNLSSQTLATAGTYTIFVKPMNTNTGSMNVAVTSP